MKVKILFLMNIIFENDLYSFPAFLWNNMTYVPIYIYYLLFI